MLKAALNYAAIGWKVFPLSPGKKTPAVGNGFKVATSDPTIIEGWWKQNPDYNIGIATESIGFVLDIDKKGDKNGFIALSALEAQFDDIPTTVMQTTPSGGEHMLFSLPEGVSLPCSVDKLGSGLDVRANGGYIVAPPSKLPNGEYEWVLDQSPTEMEMAELPGWFIKHCSAPAEKEKAPLKVDALISDGSRNDTLFKFASKLRNSGLEYNEILSATSVLNKRCSTPLPDEEIEKLVASSCKYKPADLAWDKGKGGKLLATYNNCMLFIEKSGTKIRYNDFAGFVEINGHRYQDTDTIRIKEAMRSSKLEPTVRTIDEAVQSTALLNSYHPVREYLSGLQWDGVERLESWISDHCGVPEDAYTRYLSRTALLAPVRRVFEPGCKYDTMIILEGDQGIGKSRLCAALGGAWYKSISLLGHDHNTVQLMKSAWIIEVAELSVFAKRDIESLRAFLSNPIDSARFAYARNDTVIPRQSAFIGTINPDSNGYLMDATGNRRFLPIFLNKVDVEAVERDRDQLFAEAVALYKKKVPIHIEDEELNRLVVSHQKRREFHDDWASSIINYATTVNKIEPRDIFMTACDVWVTVLMGDKKTYDKKIAIRIGNILKRLGCTPPDKTTRIGDSVGRFYNLGNIVTSDFDEHTAQRCGSLEKLDFDDF